MDNKEDMILFTPGPVHIDPGRFAALEPMHHRTGRFRRIVIESGRMLGELCGSTRQAFFFAASGTGAMEAVMANTTAPGAKVLVVEGGKFGRRWAEIARAFECDVEVLSLAMGEAVDPASVAESAGRFSPDLLALTHVESSTGLRLDLERVLSLLPEDGPLVALDAIASVGSERIRMDDWGIDVIAGAGQKALAAPAGISFAIAGDRAMKAASKNMRPGYYFSFEKYEKGLMTGDTPFTPAVHSLQLLHGSLEVIRTLGPDDLLKRHSATAGALIAAAEEAGFRSLPDTPSSSVQAFYPPAGLSCDEVIGTLGRDHGILIAGGQEELAGKIVRTGFPGIYGADTLRRLVRGLADVSGADRDRVLSRLDPVDSTAPLYG